MPIEHRLRLLIVEDDPEIMRVLRAHLARAGYYVKEATSGAAATALIDAHDQDLVLLDLGLPDSKGLATLKRLRDARGNLPVIVLSSRADEATKVAALDMGAYDYITKPFSMDELLARLRTAHRHRLRQGAPPRVFRSGDLRVDLDRRQVTRGDEVIKLSPREYELLRLMVVHAGKVLTHRFIFHEIWQDDPDIRYLRIYVRSLRQKIEIDPARPRYIRTEVGVGYCLSPPDPPELPN